VQEQITIAKNLGNNLCLHQRPSLRTTNQTEIAATVLYAARSIYDSRTRTLSEKDIPDCVMQWKQRRTPPSIKEKLD
jgi:hypothetical protein